MIQNLFPIKNTFELLIVGMIATLIPFVEAIFEVYKVDCDLGDSLPKLHDRVLFPSKVVRLQEMHF